MRIDALLNNQRVLSSDLVLALNEVGNEETRSALEFQLIFLVCLLEHVLSKSRVVRQN